MSETGHIGRYHAKKSGAVTATGTGISFGAARPRPMRVKYICAMEIRPRARCRNFRRRRADHLALLCEVSHTQRLFYLCKNERRNRRFNGYCRILFLVCVMPPYRKPNYRQAPMPRMADKAISMAFVGF